MSQADDIDKQTGTGEARDAENLHFSRLVIDKAKEEYGIVMIQEWYWHGKEQLYAQRLIEDENGMKVWQGPNPCMGYHTSPKIFQVNDYAEGRENPRLGHEELVARGFSHD